MHLPVSLQLRSPSHPRRPGHRVVLGLALLCAWPQPGLAVAPTAAHRQADFSTTSPSAEARQVANWVVASSDNHDLPFIIVDKLAARLFMFDGGGTIRATTPALLGLARGDDSPPGIGDRKLSMIARSERITPAGRFVAARGKNLRGQDILWVDYPAA